MAEPLVQLAVEDRVARVTLARPERHNALVPELLDALDAALADCARHDLAALVLAADGRSFSTGGDVAAFAAQPRGKRRSYAGALIGTLNSVILRLLDLPCPVIAAVQGPVTGGSCGLIFAADLVAMAPRAFLQPYYVDVGFAPDGGWTALLPERIGLAQAAAIQLLNRRIGPDEALALGLATAVVTADALEATVETWLAALRGKVGPSLAATRALLTPPARRAAIADGLARERDRFLALIETDATEAGMARFLSRAA
ncbi:enoyl-CoA hydratase/isomerase family protein [Phreatobacter sp. AB_2022a]|uniref:enoyl-CoA hydratase/isomerase family protein n=1 Tax=Phreatobacter sp. AB_2022a TaxID=3003134 RepID=UPI0022872B29|nr:enoyl-CoA hydratase/isomerase family protein [Phreatobacter sp. AB_2022a]MCZ0735270.1 enoyl-CoA hydratase/isomerase family protein [Phreatobacter sp. AB_2022a]